MKRILMINTGGTFSSRPGPSGLAPELTGGEIAAQLGGGISSVKLEVEGIYYIERLGRQLMFHTRSGIHASTATLQQVEEALEGKGFARCNKGYLVNLEHVDGVQDGCAMVRGDKLLISRGRRALFLEALADWVGGVRP